MRASRERKNFNQLSQSVECCKQLARACSISQVSHLIREKLGLEEHGQRRERAFVSRNLKRRKTKTKSWMLEIVAENVGPSGTYVHCCVLPKSTYIQLAWTNVCCEQEGDGGAELGLRPAQLVPSLNGPLPIVAGRGAPSRQQLDNRLRKSARELGQLQGNSHVTRPHAVGFEIFQKRPPTGSLSTLIHDTPDSILK